MFCMKCGKELKDDAVFCPACGSSQTDIEQTSQTSGAVRSSNAKTILIIIAMIAVFVIGLAAILLWKAGTVKADNQGGLDSIQPSDEAIKSSVPFANGLKVGDVVTLGTFEQDGDDINGAEPVEWDVIGEKNGSYLLISHYVLTNKEFEDGMADTTIDANDYSGSSSRITWENSSIRRWLNEEFYYTTFSDEEKDYILTVTNQNSDFPQYAYDNPKAFNHDTPLRSYGCDPTEDTVFLLSVDEFDEYFRPKTLSDDSLFVRRSYCPEAYVSPTVYAMYQGVNFRTINDLFSIRSDYVPPLYTEDFEPYIHEDYKAHGGKVCSWMLRSTHRDINDIQFAVRIMSDFTCFSDWGYNVTENKGGIRPAIWVKSEVN